MAAANGTRPMAGTNLCCINMQASRLQNCNILKTIVSLYAVPEIIVFFLLIAFVYVPGRRWLQLPGRTGTG